MESAGQWIELYTAVGAGVGWAVEPEHIVLAAWVIVRPQPQRGLSASHRSFNTHTQKKQLNKQIPAPTKTGKTSECVFECVYERV